MLICIVAGFLVAHLLKNKITRKPVRILVGTMLSIGFMVLVVLGYCMVYYNADSSAIEALKGNSYVTVTKIKGGYYFDGPGDNERALIFYPGAKVQAESYSELMLRIAESGEDCFLAVMPLNFALFSQNAANKFIDNYDYKNWDIAGHSMGGMVASGYASKSDRIDRVILLAAYPSKPMSETLCVISIYGDCDKCLSKTQYDDAKKNFPKNFHEYVIAGGNHSQMGNYGHQKGDGDATITREEQWQQIIDAINNNSL